MATPVLASHFLLIKVVRNVKNFANLLRAFTLNHIGNGFTAKVNERPDIEEIRSLYGVSFCTGGSKRAYPDNVEEGLVVNLHEHLIPFHNVVSSLARAFVVFVVIRAWIIFMMLTPRNDLLENQSSNLRQDVSVN